MARKLRVEYPGAVYHVMNRGNRRPYLDKNGRSGGARFSAFCPHSHRVLWPNVFDDFTVAAFPVCVIKVFSTK